MSNPLARRTGRVVHVVFAGVVGLLLVLAAWWFWFLAHAVQVEDALWHHAVDMEAQLVARELQSEDTLGASTYSPVPGHPQFEARRAGGDVFPQWLVTPTRQTLDEHEAGLHRLRLMIRGEGSLLLALVLGCVFMLYRLVLAEQRYRRDTDLFLGRVTHEMKTPLAGLKAMLQTLREGRVPPERLAEIAELGLRQAEREEHLIENLLTAHRLSTSAARAETSDVSLADLLREFVTHRHAISEARGGGVRLECPAGLRARANAGALLTILENLVDNAFKYGAHDVDVIAAADADGSATVVVADDGEGFDPARAEDLFRPFHRGEDPRHAGRHGTGLGLPIARALAGEMGGTLVAQSGGPGAGARFVLTLRAARAVSVA